MPSKVPTTSPQGDANWRDTPLEFVRTLYVRFMQGLFRSRPSGSYHWEPTEETEIAITDENPIKPETMGTRPGITITRGPVRLHSIGLDDMLALDQRTGQKTKSVIVPGTMAINCLSRVPIEAENIAWVVAEQFWANRELLMQAGFFEIGRLAEIGSPTKAGSIVAGDNGDEFYVCVVSSPFQFNRTTIVTPLGRRILQSLELRLTAASPNLSVGGVPSTPGAEYPTFTQSCPPSSFAPNASDVNGDTPSPGDQPPSLLRVPHPLNPAKTVVVRSVRPNSPAVKPPSIGGRTIPIPTGTVEESCGKQMDHETDPVTIKV